MAYNFGSRDANEEAYAKAYQQTITDGSLEVKDESATLLEELDKDHLKIKSAKDSMKQARIKITTPVNQDGSGTKVMVRQMDKRMNEESKEEEEVAVGPISMTEEQWVAFQYIVNRFFAEANKLQKAKDKLK